MRFSCQQLPEAEGLPLAAAKLGGEALAATGDSTFPEAAAAAAAHRQLVDTALDAMAKQGK